MNIQKILLSTISSVVLSMGAISMAGAFDVDGQATAEVLEAINVTEDATQTMDFGVFAAPPPSGVAGTVTLTSEPTTTRGSTGDVVLVGTTASSGKFTIDGGTVGRVVTITINDNAQVLNGPLGATMTFTPNAASDLTSPYTLTGTDVFHVGGSLSVSAGQAAGTYSNNTAYSVTVNYQ